MLSTATPAIAAAEPHVLARTIGREPEAVSELLPLAASPQLSVGWGQDNPHRRGSRGTGRWQEKDLSSSPLGTVLFGAMFMAVGAVVALIVTNFEPVAPSPMTRPVGLGFAGMFAAGGLLIVLSALTESLRRPRAPAGSPLWRIDYQWREVIHHEDGTGQPAGALDRILRALWLLFFFALIAAFHLPLFLSPEQIEGYGSLGGLAVELSGQTVMWIVVLVFDLVALLVIGALIHSAVQRLRFGRRSLRLLTLPAWTGGTLRAELSFSRGLRAVGPTRCTLHCVDESRRADSSASGTPADSLVSVYREVQELDTAGKKVRRLRVEFEIPPDAPGTRLRETPRIFWRLIVHVPARGPDYRGDFLVPVYAPEPHPSASEMDGNN
jgi:hypothetical protein